MFNFRRDGVYAMKAMRPAAPRLTCLQGAVGNAVENTQSGEGL